jgi:hypothetical protein
VKSPSSTSTPIWYAIAASPSSANAPRATRRAVLRLAVSKGSGYAIAVRWNGAVARPASVQMIWSRPGPTLINAIGAPTKSEM